jgi:predicted  nucleic acid-binding Zn-ribbon protein
MTGMIEVPNVDPVLTHQDGGPWTFARSSSSGSIDLEIANQSQGVIYQMSEDKSLGQTYHEEVEELKAQGVANADAVRQVAQKYDKKENAVRGGIHQYKARHIDGAVTGTVRRARRKAEASVDDLLASARKSIEDALALVEREPDQLKANIERLKNEVAAAEARYEQAVAAAKDKKAELEKKLKALS